MLRITAASIVCLLSLASGATYAQATCNATVAEKKLAGAARTSFMKKCEADAKAACDAQAAEKKLAGAAKTSFAKKCMSDAVGEAAKG
ncbi:MULTISPECIES: PsiF family protein [unclassified Variovorax]|uniref:PsiF family protein n=1 Tax=unclassified Variovorax TaxID=663243 RepID=UPI00076BFAC3|nr:MULTISPECIES: PsiF family protein [unclassified Variovorax]KWT98609.1 hypothetical protein APY03_0297 [Variovorax sp. WDL1]PNG50553.1 hypothetical protein CHC06_06177 [Variovorax sp. B2]PNG51422.1 hypothetical protein CHC07_06079 [Variovorax sp. B4]VTU42207.1 psiF repeat [Variovorax sp. RA8]VTV17720.1 hypothetical protein WDL1P1_00612 [Variovorax sp. WDL1]